MFHQAYEKSEDPIYVLENNLPIDPKYYLDNQITKVVVLCCINFSHFDLRPDNYCIHATANFKNIWAHLEECQ